MMHHGGMFHGGGFSGMRGGAPGRLEDEELGRVYDHEVVKRLAPHFRPHLAYILVALGVMLIYTGTQVAIPWLISFAIDDQIIPAVESGSRDLAGLHIIGGAFFTVVILNFIGNYAYLRMLSKVSQQVLYTLRTRMYEHLQRLSVPFFDRNEVGRVMSRVQNDVEQLHEFLPMVVLSLGDTLSIVGIVAVMLWMNWQLALVTFTVIPVLIVIMLIWQRYAREAFVRIRWAIAVVNANLQQSIAGVQVVQSLNREDLNFKEFDRVNHVHLNSWLKAIRLSAGLMPSVEVLTATGLLLVILIGGRMVIDGSLQVGELIAFALFIQRFFDPVRNLTMQYTQLQRAMTAGARIVELLKVEPEVLDRPDGIAMPRITSAVRYEGVGFEYTEGTPVLQEINLEIKAGQTVALIGRTGAGKTTMVSLLARFYDVTQGKITVDGYDLREVTRASLVGQMSMVPQEPYLFSATVAENIRYCNREAKDESVIAAAKSVGAHDFIILLKDGYDTVLQERGGNLSVGQRQLISFARAVLADPQIIILDEATANVDTFTEVAIQKALRVLLDGRTAVIIAHRLSTIQKADAIVVMEQGKIADIGTHEELMARGGLYSRLYHVNFPSSQVLTDGD